MVFGKDTPSSAQKIFLVAIAAVTDSLNFFEIDIAAPQLGDRKFCSLVFRCSVLGSASHPHKTFLRTVVLFSLEPNATSTKFF